LGGLSQKRTLLVVQGVPCEPKADSERFRPDLPLFEAGLVGLGKPLKRRILPTETFDARNPGKELERLLLELPDKRWSIRTPKEDSPCFDRSILKHAHVAVPNANPVGLGGKKTNPSVYPFKPDLPWNPVWQHRLECGVDLPYDFVLELHVCTLLGALFLNPKRIRQRMEKLESPCFGDFFGKKQKLPPYGRRRLVRLDPAEFCVPVAKIPKTHDKQPFKGLLPLLERLSLAGIALQSRPRFERFPPFDQALQGKGHDPGALRANAVP